MAGGVTVTWKGAKETESALIAIPGLTRRGMENGFDAIGLLVQNSAKQKVLKGPATGRIYTGGGRSAPHQASQPGESPANDFGFLLASIQYDFNKIALEVIIYAGKAYAAALEYGTKRNGGERPFMRPALTENVGKIIQILTAYAQEELRNGN